MVGALCSVLLVIFLSAPTFEQSTPLSPCPNVFSYEAPGSEAGRWYGVVTLSTDITLHGLWLNIVLDSKADILGNWVGDVTTTDNTDFKVENTKMKIHPGPATAVRFFVQYNQLNKVPKLQAIRLNGREICNANQPRPAVDINTDTRPSDFTPRPTTRPEQTTRSRPDTSSRPQNTNSRPQSTNSRPQERPQDRPQERPQDRPAVIRPEDRPITRPVQGRPSGEGPVYVPTQNPPIEQSNINPYSIGGGQVSAQSVGTQTGNNQNGYKKTTQRPRPSSYDDPDFVDEDSRPNDDDYFNGGIPTIVNVAGSNAANGHTTNKRQEQCGKVIRNANPNPLVVNGKPTLEGQWPWQIALYQTKSVDNKYICGGTLVSRRFAITAAHCVTRNRSNRVVNKNTLTVYLGKHNLRTSVEGVQIRLVSEIFVHDMYNASSFSRDVGILQLREAVQYTDWVRPACLWPEDQVDLTFVIGKRGSVVGWGFDDKGVATEELSLVEMPVVDQETCIRSYSDFFARFTSEFTFCAGYKNGVPDSQSGNRKSTSVCNGDSGGGMVFLMQGSWYLRGLVSLSVARQNEYRCDPTHYVVFTDLAKFLHWIRQTIGNDS